MAMENISVVVQSRKVCLSVRKCLMKPFPDPYAVSKVSDTIESGGNSICWFGKMPGYGHLVLSNVACFCHTDLCNIGSSMCVSFLFEIITLLLHMWK